MDQLIKPHGSDSLNALYVADEKKRTQLLKEAEGLPKLLVCSQAAANAVMMGSGYFNPLTGYMNLKDSLAVAESMKTTGGLFWPVPIVNVVEDASTIKGAKRIALLDPNVDGNPVLAIQDVESIDEATDAQMKLMAEKVYGTTSMEHPGAKNFLSVGKVFVAGPIQVLNYSYFGTEFPETFRTAVQIREMIKKNGWRKVVAFQTRNPMHRAHEALVKIAMERTGADGSVIHMLLGKLKAGDIPAEVRVNCINTLVENYFVKERVVTGGYPLDMRYGGPREGLLHGVFRQNFGCTHMIIGRDHAGVGDYYGPFDAQDAYHNLWEGALECKMLPIDWTFYCHKCDGMASMKTCPHSREDRVMLSGTALRKALSEGGDVPSEFSRKEVLDILREYYSGLTEKVEIKLHGHATGEAEKKK